MNAVSEVCVEKKRPEVKCVDYKFFLEQKKIKKLPKRKQKKRTEEND